MIEETGKYLERKVRRWCRHPMIVGTRLPSELLCKAIVAVWERKPTRYRTILERLRGKSLCWIEEPELKARLDVASERLLGSMVF